MIETRHQPHGTRHPYSWPSGHAFALFLSHDVDQIHDREMWRILADLNHIRRVIFNGERGSVPLALRRVGRAFVRPKPAVKDFATILEIEARHGFRSTFFVLHDRYWARYGARFRLTDAELKAIGELVKGAGGEIGVHGGYYRFNDGGAYRESREAIAEALGVEPVGIRNHLLRFSGSETWRAQHEAGFAYDATFGSNAELGGRDGKTLPFWAVPTSPDGSGGLVELPLTVMDSTLFRALGLAGQAALQTAWAAIEPVVASGGLVTLSWHNNYFNEPEYWDWQWVYEELLQRLAALKPWCATGAEIQAWWRSPAPQSAVTKGSEARAPHEGIDK